jgi:peptidase M23-like protein
MPRLIRLCAGVLAAASLAVFAGSAAAAPTGLRPGTAFSLFSASVLTHPAPVAATDGRVHIAYELVLTNMTRAKIGVDKLEVRDARTHHVLLWLSGEALARNTNPVGGAEPSESVEGDLLRHPMASLAAASSAATTIAGSQAAVVWLDVVVPNYAAVPARLDHRIVASFVSPPPGAPDSLSQELTPVKTVRHRPVVLSAPVGNGDWYASDSCCADDTHHRRGLGSLNGRMLVPQRFAIDWYRVDSEHQAWVGDPKELKSYLAYDQPVLASAAGTVVDIQDGLPNNPDIPKPPPIPPIEDTVGNHIVLKVSPGVFLLYAHLDRGSLKVKLGEHVRRGEVLGLIGTSGNSTVPHLHFQVMTTRTFFPTDSPPFVFTHFKLLGRVTERIWDDVLGLQPTGKLPFRPASPVSTHRLEMPLDREVVSFERAGPGTPVAPAG